MPNQAYVPIIRRPSFLVFALTAVGGSMLIRKLQNDDKADQMPQDGDFTVNTTRSGGGV